MSVASCAKATFSRTSRNVAGTVVMVEPLSSGICHWSLPVSADRAIPPLLSALCARTTRAPSNLFRLAGRHEMAFEPGTRDARHRVERPGFFEEMRRPRDADEVLLATEPCERRPVQLDHHGVSLADDEQRRSPDPWQDPIG